MGYSRAGFEVVGVDIKWQKSYPFEQITCDATEFLEIAPCFDAVHASPPCQFASSLKSLHKDREHLNLIPKTRELLLDSGLPYVIENVPQAKPFLRDPVLICGSMFDPPMDVRRHRLFETNWGLSPTPWPCRHKLWDYRYRSLDGRKGKSRVVAVHGQGKQMVPMSRVVGVHGHSNYLGDLEMRKEAMGIEWMSIRELSQAIPPAYTEFIGKQLFDRCVTLQAESAEQAAPKLSA